MLGPKHKAKYKTIWIAVSVVAIVGMIALYALPFLF